MIFETIRNDATNQFISFRERVGHKSAKSHCYILHRNRTTKSGGILVYGGSLDSIGTL